LEREELEQYTEELETDLKKTGEESLFLVEYFDEGWLIEPDKGRIPNMPTVLDGKNLDNNDGGLIKGEGDQDGGDKNEESNKQEADEEDESGEDNSDDLEETLN